MAIQTLDDAIAALKRQYSIAPMGTHDFNLDAIDVDRWLRTVETRPFNEQLLIDEIRRLRAQVDQLTADAIIRADRQAILIQAMWHIREMSLYDHDREIATKVLTDIGELR